MSESADSDSLFRLLEREAEESGVSEILDMSERYSEVFGLEIESDDKSSHVETIVSNNTR